MNRVIYLKTKHKTSSSLMPLIKQSYRVAELLKKRYGYDRCEILSGTKKGVKGLLIRFTLTDPVVDPEPRFEQIFFSN